MPIRDLIYAVRTLRKSPVFAITAIVTMALAIGATTAIFSVTNAVLLRPLPYRDPERLVFAISDMSKRAVKDFPLSDADFLDVRNGTAGVFEELGAVFTGRLVAPRGDGTPEQIRLANVTTNFFHMMGGRVALGRDFRESDGTPGPLPAPGEAPAAQPPAMAILSYDYWQRRFGGDPAVLGRPVPGVGARGTEIVGVLAPGFELLFPSDAGIEQRPDVWFAGRLAYDNANRNSVSLRAIGRLRAGVTLERAQSAAGAAAAELRRNFLIERTAGFEIRLEPMQRHVVEEVRPALLALMGAVVLLLLIACANVANLLLVRASLRQRELAVRTALGGSRWRLVRQVLSEAFVLSAAGTVLGVILAQAGTRELLAIAPANLPRLDTVSINAPVVAFAAGVGLLAAVLFGLVPAWRASRPDIMQVLRAGGRTAALGGGGVLRNLVAVAEVALSFVLLVGSGLMVRSFIALQKIDPGYDPHGLLTFQLLGGPAHTTPDERAALMRQIQGRLAALPGVRGVTASFPFPLAGGFSPIRWGLEAARADPTRFQAVDFQLVLPGYFDTLRTRLIAGRTFTSADNAPDRKLVVVDQMLARKAFPGEPAVGRRILIRIRTPEPESVEIIGVVAHQRDSSLAEAGREQIYFTDGYLGHGAVDRWAIRTSANPAALAGAVRSEIARFDPHLLIAGLEPMEALVDKAQAGTRFELLLIGTFAVIAALLAAVGLYGVLATLVRQRTAEIGVRMALGTAPARVFALVVGGGMRLSAAGIVVGAVAALALTRAMSSLLVGVKPADPLTFGLMAAVFLAIAAAASWLPARRAAALDPTLALRQE